MPSTKDQETYHYAPWWWSKNIQPHEKRGNVQMAYRMIKRTPPRNDVSIMNHGNMNNPNSHPSIQQNFIRLYIIQF